MRTTSTLDADGLNLLTSNNVTSAVYSDTKKESFGNPPSDFTGYGYDGLKRTLGVVDETDVATWATEVASSDRGVEDPFPSRVFIISNGNSVVILNADDLKVWMRFNYSNTVIKVSFDDGYLAVLFTNQFLVYSFIKDKFWHITTGYAREYTGVASRNNLGSYVSGSQRAKGLHKDVDVKKVLGSWYMCIAHVTGLTAIDLGTFNISSSTLNHNIFEKAITLDQTDSVTITSQEIIQSPPYVPENPVDYSNDALRGDRIKFTSPVSTIYELFITKTLSDRFIFSGVVNSNLVGNHSTVELSVLKPGAVCKINSDGSLFFSGGESFFRSVSSWINGSIDVFSQNKSVSSVNLELTKPFYDVKVSGSEYFIASSEGILVTTNSLIESNSPSELRYSDNPAATYFELFSGIRPTTAVGIDPQNGNVLIGFGSSIIEVQPQGGLQKIIRTIAAGGTVNNILTFSNAENDLGV